MLCFVCSTLTTHEYMQNHTAYQSFFLSLHVPEQRTYTIFFLFSTLPKYLFKKNHENPTKHTFYFIPCKPNKVFQFIFFSWQTHRQKLIVDFLYFSSIGNEDLHKCGEKANRVVTLLLLLVGGACRTSSFDVRACYRRFVIHQIEAYI